MPQLDVIDRLAETLPQPTQWIAFLDRLVPAVYELDADLSAQCKLIREDMDYFVRDLDCIDYDAHLPKPITARVAIDYLAGLNSDRHVDVRRIMTRVDQVLGRHRVLELANAG